MVSREEFVYWVRTEAANLDSSLSRTLRSSGFQITLSFEDDRYVIDFYSADSNLVYKLIIQFINMLNSVVYFEHIVYIRVLLKHKKELLYEQIVYQINELTPTLLSALNLEDSVLKSYDELIGEVVF